MGQVRRHATLFAFLGSVLAAVIASSVFNVDGTTSVLLSFSAGIAVAVIANLVKTARAQRRPWWDKIEWIVVALAYVSMLWTSVLGHPHAGTLALAIGASLLLVIYGPKYVWTKRPKIWRSYELAYLLFFAAFAGSEWAYVVRNSMAQLVVASIGVVAAVVCYRAASVHHKRLQRLSVNTDEPADERTE